MNLRDRLSDEYAIGVKTFLQVAKNHVDQDIYVYYNIDWWHSLDISKPFEQSLIEYLKIMKIKFSSLLIVLIKCY